MNDLRQKNILFICTANCMRSPTAEKIFSEYPGIIATSAGINEYSPVKLTHDLIRWADLIFVMEQRHYEHLMRKHLGAIYDKEIVILGIVDQYQFMDPELIEILKNRVTPYLDDLENEEFRASSQESE